MVLGWLPASYLAVAMTAKPSSSTSLLRCARNDVFNPKSPLAGHNIHLINSVAHFGKEHYLDSTVKIRWNLKTLNNQDKDYEIFSIPFIITVEEVFVKIRNLKYRYLPDGTLFPLEYLRYEPFVIRESIHNCIAHQDYSKKARINVVEFEDEHLFFSNYGSFLPKSVEDVVLKDTPEELYRNPFLVEAMRNLDMIETQDGTLRNISKTLLVLFSGSASTS